MVSGQAESGKSTTLKAFKLQYAPRQFAKELELWSAVILHNLIAGINSILDVLNLYEKEHGLDETSPLSNSNNIPRRNRNQQQQTHIVPMSRELITLRLRLRLLVKCDASIRAWLDPTISPASNSPPISGSKYGSEFSPSSPGSSSGFENFPGPSNIMQRRGSQPDLAVRATYGQGFGINFLKRAANSGDAEPYKAAIREKDYQAARTVIQACAEDMQALWTDPTVKAILGDLQVDLSERYG